VTPIPAVCPCCHHDVATLTLSSASVVSVACAKCHHDLVDRVRGDARAGAQGGADRDAQPQPQPLHRI